MPVRHSDDRIPFAPRSDYARSLRHLFMACHKNIGFSAIWILAVGACLIAGCSTWKINSVADRLKPSNFRDWSPEFKQVSRMIRDGDRVTIDKVRNNVYMTETDFVLDYYERSFDLEQIRSVDFIVVPFQTAPMLAHTMLSFGLDDGTQLVISVEIRTEKGEKYSPVLGLSNQYEISYVVADERDVIRLRTRHRNADVYVYPTIATARQSQQLFLDMMNRANKLADQPEFYDTILNNCTTNLVKHVNQIKNSQVPYAWQVLFPGHSDRYAYQLGLLDRSIPFEQLKQQCHVNELAEKYYDDADFSSKIRTRSHANRKASKMSDEEFRGIVSGGANQH